MPVAKSVFDTIDQEEEKRAIEEAEAARGLPAWSSYG